MIKKLQHYSIPAKCKTAGGCPFDFSQFMPKAWETRYTELELGEGDRLRSEQTGAYTQQGGCTDGQYIYRAFVEEDTKPTKLQKLDMTGAVVLERTLDVLGHANDMTYCSKDGYIYVAHSSSTSIVYKVSPSTLAVVDTINIAPSIWGIAYNATDDIFLLGNVGSAYISVYTYDFKFMYRIKPANPFSGLVRQGIACDENYIYLALDNAYGTVIENEKGSRIMVYTYNGMFIKSIYIDIKEIEFLAVNGQMFIIGTYEGRDENNVKTCDLYKTTFDLYPTQTVITGRPTDVSGGLNNLQRLPEGTPVRLWDGSLQSGVVTLQVPARLTLSEDGPFRYLRFRFKGANQQVFDWYPTNNGVVTLREVDITDAQEDSTIRIREMRLTFSHAAKTFTIETNFLEEIKHDKSEGAIAITKDRTGALATLIEVTQIWGIV